MLFHHKKSLDILWATFTSLFWVLWRTQFLHYPCNIIVPSSPWTSKWSSLFRSANFNDLRDYKLV